MYKVFILTVITVLALLFVGNQVQGVVGNLTGMAHEVSHAVESRNNFLDNAFEEAWNITDN